jgi:adenosylcobinamide amidohydrolase
MPGKPRPRAPLAIFAADDRRGIRHGTLNVVVAIDSTLAASALARASVYHAERTER